MVSCGPSACGHTRRYDAVVDLTPPPKQRPPPLAGPEQPLAQAAADAGRRAPVVLAKSKVVCKADPRFPAVLDVPEASGAAEVLLTPGVRELLVISDSGGGGTALAWAIPGGPARKLRLPVEDAASDDIEGLAWHDGHVFALTSSGAMRRYAPDGQGGVRRDQDAYAVASPPLACDDLGDSNCGANFEGLCLRNTPAPGKCDGYAASKALAGLYCLAWNGELLEVTREPLALPLGKDVLSDCAFGAPGPSEDVLLVTTNVYGGSVSYVVDEATGDLSPIEVPPTLNNEAVATDEGGALYTLMDDNGQKSAGGRYLCTGWK